MAYLTLCAPALFWHASSFSVNQSINKSIHLCMPVEVKGQSVGVVSFLPVHRSWGPNLVISLCGKSHSEAPFGLSKDEGLCS